MKLSEENTEVNLHDLGFGNGFLDLIPKTKLQKKKQMNWTSSKDIIKKVKKHKMGENTWKSYIYLIRV